MAAQFGVDILFKANGADQAFKKLAGGADQLDAAVAKVNGKLKTQQTTNAKLATDLRRLKGDYDKLTAAAKASAKAGGEGFSKDTISRLRGLSTEINRTREAFRAGKSDAAAYKAELDRVASSAAKAAKANSGIRGTMGRAGRGAGAGIAAAGAFSGIPGFAAISSGAAAGGLAGGPAGAVAGATAAAVAAVGAAALSTSKDIAIWYAELKRSQIALEGVSNGSVDFQSSLEGLERISKRLNVPIGEATQNYTQLRAAMGASGYEAKDALKVFEALSAANKALGGDNEKLNGIMLATSQVFSKGKVTAEELRGQIGERLPGAMAAFATATGRTTAQLDEDLQNGEVSLADFVKFAEYMGQKYGKTADDMASSGEDAGARLTTAWDDFKKALGPILSEAGAGIQEFATNALKAITPLIDKLNELGRSLRNNRLYELNSKLLPDAIKQLEAVRNDPKGLADAQNKAALKFAEAQLDALKNEKKSLEELLYSTAKPPTKEDKPDTIDQVKDKEKKKEKELYDFANQNAAALAQNQIALNNQVFQNEMAQLRQRYELEQTYIEKLAALRGAGLSPGGRGIFGAVSQFNAQQKAYEAQRRQLEEQVKTAEQAVKAAQAGVGVAALQGAGNRVAGGSASGRYIQGGIGPRGANQYGPHFDIKRSDGSYFSRNALDQFVEVNGRPLSSGVTVPGGEFGAPRSYGPHAGWDFAFGGGASLGLKGGAKWLGSTPGSYGDNAVFQTPDGKIYKIIHGKFNGSAGGTSSGQQIAPGGQANLTGQIGAQGDVATAQAGLAGAKEQLAQFNAEAEKLKALDFPTLLATMSQSWMDQTLQLENQTAALQLRSRLEQEGVNPALIEAELKKLELRQRMREEIEGLDAALKLHNDTQGKAGINAEQHAAGLEKVTQGAAAAAAAVDKLAEATKAANDPINQLVSQWSQELGDTRGRIASLAQTVQGELAGAMSSAITGLIDGTQTVEQAFSQMFKNIGKAFIDMATQMLAQQMVLGILRMFGGAAGGGFGGFSGAGPFSFGGGGSGATAFMPGFAGFFADGGTIPAGQFGVVGEAGPELVSSTGRGTQVTPMGAAMQRYNPANASLRDQLNESGGPGGAGSKIEPVINIQTGNVMQFEGSNYVSQADFQMGLHQAAKQGAAMGEKRTLDRLKNSPGARRRIGL